MLNIIEQREYGISDKEKMGTHLVTACIVVIAQDPENKKSVLGHIDLRTNVETAISQDILGKFPEDKKLNVYLLGGSDSSDAKYTSQDNLKKVINKLKKSPNIDIKSADILDKHKSPSMVFDPQTSKIEYATPGKRTEDQALRSQRLFLEENPQGLNEAFDFTVSKEVPPMNLSNEKQKELINYYFSSRLLPDWSKIKNIIGGPISFATMSYNSYQNEQETVDFFWKENPALVQEVFRKEIEEYVVNESSISSSDKQQISKSFDNILKDSKITLAKLLLKFNELKSNPEQFIKSVKLQKIQSLVKNIDLTPKPESPTTLQNSSSSKNTNQGWKR